MRAVGALLLLVPVAIAVIEQAFVNRWMTGSAMSSPYVFGDASFRSVNWLDPLFVPVLLHPWHGLLVYHPLYAVAFVAVVVCALRSPSRRERILWTAALVAVVANLWVQAAWYAWWLGTATFGMRGMAPAAILLVAALARVIGGVAPRESPRRFAVRGWVAVTLVCCLWSSLLLLQGTSQFYTWQDVLAGQSAAIGGLLAPRVLGSVAAAAAIVLGGWLWARRSARLANPITVRSDTGGHAEPWVAPAAVLLASLSLAYLMLSAQPRWTTASRSLYLPAVLLLVLVGIIFVALRLAGAFVSSYRNQRGWIDGRTRPSSGEHSCLPRYSGNAPLDRDSLPESPLPPDPRPPDAGRLSRSLARLAVTLWFVLSCFLFARLALITERRLAAGDVPDRGYRYAASFDVQNALTGLREYQRIDGFDDRKEALRRFLEAHGARLRR